MINTLLARIGNLNQYNKRKGTIIWEDPTENRWVNTYGKLTLDDNVIFINNENKIFIGTIGKITNRKSVTVINVDEYSIKNDEFLQLNSIFPELTSRVKANFQPFLHAKEINIKNLIADINAKKFVDYYIFNSIEDFRELNLDLQENDRIIILEKGIFRNVQLSKNKKLIVSPQNNLFNVAGKSLNQLLKITEDYKGKDSNSNNVKRLKDIIASLKREKYYKFKTFFSYHDALYNSRIYGNNNVGITKTQIDEKSNPVEAPLNQILFGPPGTGKTYHSIDKALKIIGEKEEKELDYDNRDDVKKQFDKRVDEGRIVFTTFHQSMSYEDFIEGIKPVMDGDDADVEIDEFNDLQYEIRDGIFKSVANLARGVSGTIEKAVQIDFDNKDFYKMSLGGKHRPEKHNWSIKNDLIFLGWGDDKDFTGLNAIKDWKRFRDQFKEQFRDLVDESKYVIQAVFAFQKMRIGDIVFVTKGNNIIDAIGIITSDYFYDDSHDIDNYQFRRVKWLATNLNATPDIFINKKISQQTIYQFYNDDVKTSVLDGYFNSEANLTSEPKKYVLIIDEINRGNVSQIFGELITLIEQDKRINQNESLEITLPYSKQKFGVPDNLYIIGTMNTADRSVEALDTALRRRFSFEEMPPKYDLAELQNSVYGFQSFEIVEVINRRIEKLLDRDHAIGHSYFLNKDEDSLIETFYRCVIPLLQEYFFGDYEKMGLILGKGFVQLDKSTDATDVFADFDTESAQDYMDKSIYRIVDHKDNPVAFSIALSQLMNKKVEKA